MNQDLSVPEHPSVLVIDDESGTSDMLVMALRFLGFDAHLVATGAGTVAEIQRLSPDAVLLDGTEICGRLRAAGLDTPVIFLSARTTVEDKCHALAAGGDDYVTKPFDLTEVSARIRALIRRARGAVRPAPLSSRRLCAAGVELDAGTREVWCHGTAVPLSATEFALLKVLLENAGQVISKAHILDTVWNYGFQGESGVVETYVYYLRRKLGDSGQSLIRTVRGAGYIVHAD
ncbi:response regulator transcription factor [Streptomyces geranii]|uniref:response regulator transcription factor n=1 Tax=Streptomyces geranii TaxID=2058923 RepID=UPI0018E58FF8|nr:response regulator transcription factor [Streptomyces geranii]